MEMVAGLEIHLLLRAKQEFLTVKEVVDIFRQLARGIDAAHAVNVIHRDIKPSNMIYTLPQKVAKIMDFGIARGKMENVFSTQTGLSMGTPAFMSPEQIRGEDVGPASDIYSFGMSLYSFFARAMPFNSTNTAEYLVAHINQKPIPLRNRNPEWPDALEEVLARALSKDPQSRHLTACRFIDEIEQALIDQQDKIFSDFFKSSGKARSIKLVREINWLKKEKLLKPLIFIIIAVGITGLSFVYKGLFFGNTSIPPPVITPEPSQTAISSNISVTPVESPVMPDITPELTPGDSPAPSPTGASIELTPTPEATEISIPEKTQIITPTPLVTAIFEEAYEWGPEIQGAQRIIDLKFIDRIFVQGLRRPLFRSQVKKAIKYFSEVDTASKDNFFNGVKKLLITHKDIKLIYIRTSEKIDENRAEIRFRTGLSGLPLYPDSRSRLKQLVPIFDAVVHLKKMDGEWFLVDWPEFFP
jgi:serine/threonine protein kinase